MKIKLHFSNESTAALKGMGLRQMSPESLRWTTDHPASHYGAGVLLRGKSGEILDGRSFAAMTNAFGAWIELTIPVPGVFILRGRCDESEE